MQSTCSKLFVLLALMLTALPSYAAKEEKKGKKSESLGPFTHAITKIDSLDLKEDVKTKVTAIVDEYKPKFTAVVKKSEGNITDEQKKAVHDALKQAKTDGKKGKEMKQVADDALKLTDDQKKAKEEGTKELNQLSQDFKKALTGVLTAEQVGELGLEGKKKNK